MKMYWGMTLALDAGDWSTLRPWVKVPVPIAQEAGWAPEVACTLWRR
jgi:hypothetical protein